MIRKRAVIEAAHVLACRRVHANPLSHTDTGMWMARRDALAWVLGWQDSLGGATLEEIDKVAQAELAFERRMRKERP